MFKGGGKGVFEAQGRINPAKGMEFWGATGGSG